MGIWDEWDTFIGGLDGKIIAGDLYFVYDEDHKRKVKELVDRDQRYLYEIEKKCGIDPNDESYYGPDTDIRIINIDHFAIKASLKNKADELKKIVYDAIDEVYANADSYDFSDDDDDPDFDTWDFDDDED